jgi:hypothetical protein
MTPGADLDMAREYQAQLDALGPNPGAEQIREAKDWNAAHDWRAYRQAWELVRLLNGGTVP